MERPYQRSSLLSSDEETEDAGDHSPMGEGKAEGEGTNDTPPATEELLVEKKRATKRKFTEDMLVGPCGLRRLYDTFPEKCRMRGRGYEVSYSFQ